jgi:hypothetical protein
MNSDLDPELWRLFAQQAQAPLADEQFTAALLLKIERTRRARLWYQGLAIVAAVIVVALNIEPLLEGTAAAMRVGTAAAVRMAGDLPPSRGEFLITPTGWAVSMLLGGWVLLRTRPSRR